MVPAEHMPSSDIMCEEVEQGKARAPGDPLRKVACGALEWLRAHAHVHFLREVHRFGPAVVELARRLSHRYGDLCAQRNWSPNNCAGDQVPESCVGVFAGGYISHLSCLFSATVAYICASSAAMLFRHCRPPFFCKPTGGTLRFP